MRRFVAEGPRIAEPDRHIALIVDYTDNQGDLTLALYQGLPPDPPAIAGDDPPGLLVPSRPAGCWWRSAHRPTPRRAYVAPARVGGHG